MVKNANVAINPNLSLVFAVDTIADSDLNKANKTLKYNKKLKQDVAIPKYNPWSLRRMIIKVTSIGKIQAKRFAFKYLYLIELLNILTKSM